MASAWPLLLVVGLLLSACTGPSDTGRLLQLTGGTMGTRYAVKIAHPSTHLDLEETRLRIAQILDDVDGRMSTYKQDSELSQFNRNRSTQWIPISGELLAVMSEALHVSERSSGALDVTVGPLVDLWGFGPTPRTDQVPSDQEIDEQLQRIGHGRLRLRRSPPAVQKDGPEIAIDLSAVAKGYAVDQVADYLESQGIENFMVEVGGEVRARGTNARGTPWQIAIETPIPTTRSVYSVVAVDGQALATSGDYRNYFEEDGKRFSHTIDPRTGRPIEHALASVTVLSDSAMRADAFATALMVLGPQAGFEVADQEGLAAFFIMKTANGFKERATPAFQRHIAHQRDQ